MDSSTRDQRAGFVEHVVATVDGLTLYYRDYPAIAPITGLPVICLHGLTRNSRDFEIVAPRIAALGRRVIAPDMRGRGKSANDDDPAHYVPAVYAQDVLTLLDHLSLPSAVFIGTSMGGIITLVVAAIATTRIAAVVLNDIGGKVEPAGLSYIATYLGHPVSYASWAEAGAGVRANLGMAYPDKENDAAFWEMLAHRTCREREDGHIEPDYDLTIALTFGDPETSPPIDLSPLFQNLAAKPVLSVRGALSNLLSPESVAGMRAQKPDLATVEVPNTGHAPLLTEPEAWDALLDFLATAP